MGASLAALGATYTDLVLNALFRGSVGTPPSTLYFSLGASGSTTVPTEITTTRTAVKVNRGWLSGLDSSRYQYQSSGGAFGSGNIMTEGFDIYCTGMGSNTYLDPCLLVYDAASAGNLLGAFEPVTGPVIQVINNDILRVGRAYYDSTSDGGFTPTYTLSQPASSTNYAKLMGNFSSSGVLFMGAYPYAMLFDWLWRGFDSVNTLYPVGTYPNVYLNFADGSTGNEITTIPRLGLSRSTGAWSAPAYVSPGTNLERKITNSVDLNFASTTGSGSYSNPYLHIRMASTPQAFSDILYAIQFTAYTLTFNFGDNITFLAGNLDLILN